MNQTTPASSGARLGPFPVGFAAAADALHIGIDDCCNQARKLFAIIRAIDIADPDLRNVEFRPDGSIRDRDDFSPLNLVNVDTDEDGEE